MLKKVLILFFGAALMASCNESFNSIYEEVEEPDPNVVPPGEVDLRNVNILPTLSDPLYSIDNATRGAGEPFEGYEKDKEHWLATRFNVFGLLTGNRVGGSANYSAASRGDKQYGVLWNQTMGISDQQGHTVFYDGDGKPMLCKYNPDDKLYRYKFFMLGTDGLDADFRVDGNNTVVARMDLDGHHDVMHSFAYHTDKQYAEAVKQLPSDETTKIFLDGGQDNLYNRMSGNRGLNPIFNVNHLLSRFDIKVKGGNPQGNNTCDFLKVFIKDVNIVAAKKVDVTVCNDKWERDDYLSLFSHGNLITPVGSFSPYTLDIVPNEMRNTSFTTSNRGDIDFDFLSEECTMLSNKLDEPIIPEGSHWVGSTEADSLCKTVLLPPLMPDEGHFTILLKYRYVYMTKGEDGNYFIGQVKGGLDKPAIWDDYDSERIVIPNVDTEGNPVVYEGGRRYTIVITVYGKFAISVDVVSPMMWNDGDGDHDIPVGGD